MTTPDRYEELLRRALVRDLLATLAAPAIAIALAVLVWGLIP